MIEMYRNWPLIERPRSWILIWGRASQGFRGDDSLFFWTRQIEDTGIPATDSRLDWHQWAAL